MTYVSPLKGLHPVGTEYADIGDATVPWHYGDVDKEYGALRSQAALLDLSSVGLLAVRGDVIPFLQDVLARDVEFLTPELCMTSLILDESGSVVDIVTVYGLEDGVLLETSFGCRETTLAHLNAIRPDGVTVTDLTDERVVIGIEGPYSWGVVGRLIDQEFTALPYQSVVETEWDGESVLFARTGFTGEYGYKFITDIATAERMWEAIASSAEPCGQAALETAMLEVRQPILHRELVDTTVLAAGAGWLTDRTKESFRGRDAVQQEFEAGLLRHTVGGRADVLPIAGSSVTVGGVEVGEIVHAVRSPRLGEAVVVARVDVAVAAAGVSFEVTEADGDPGVLTTMSSPYVVPTSWSVPIF